MECFGHTPRPACLSCDFNKECEKEYRKRDKIL